MFSGRTLSILAIIGFLISMSVWFMGGSKEKEIRGKIIDKAVAECRSNINFLNTGNHILASKDEVDDVLKELKTAGRAEMDYNWLGTITGGTRPLFTFKEDKKTALNGIIEAMASYNEGLSYAAYSQSRSEDDEEGYSSPPQAPAKEQMLRDMAALNKQLLEAKEHGNNFNY